MKTELYEYTRLKVAKWNLDACVLDLLQIRTCPADPEAAQWFAELLSEIAALSAYSLVLEAKLKRLERLHVTGRWKHTDTVANRRSP